RSPRRTARALRTTTAPPAIFHESLRLLRMPARSPHPARRTRSATTTSAAGRARRARWPSRPRRRSADSQSPAHQIDALQQGDRDDAADRALSPDPVVNDDRRRGWMRIKDVAVAIKRERDDDEVEPYLRGRLR